MIKSEVRKSVSAPDIHYVELEFHELLSLKGIESLELELIKFVQQLYEYRRKHQE